MLLTTCRMEKIKIIVVDDHNLFRMMLKSTFQADYPDICIVGEAENGGELFRVLSSTPADLVLLDINLPDIWGVEIARRLRGEYPAVKILAVSAENTSETIQAMLEAGIDGFISKQRGDANELALAIRTVMNGMEYFGRDISAIIFDVYVAKKKTSVISAEFTEREREIILLCRDGLMCKEIADRLGISFHTVNNHKKNIFQKLGINTTMEMVQYALKKGIIRIEN
jgi:two-component system response regulator NreC